MEELISRVTQKTGISDQQAKGAVDTVIGYLKEKLPAPIAGQVDGILSGGGKTGGLGDVMGGMGGMLGKQ
jgi:hypothetical protein